MAIENGSVASADEVMNAIGNIFNDSAQTIFNSEYIGWNSDLMGNGTPRLNNVLYDTALTDTYYSDGVAEYDFTSGTISDTWTGSGTGSGGQADGRIYAVGTNDSTDFYSYTSSAATDELKMVDGSYLIDFYVNYTGIAGATAQLSITDGSATVNIFSGAGTARNIRKLNLSKTNETCLFTTDFTSTTFTGVDLSSLNNALDWNFVITGGATDNDSGGTSQMNVYNILLLDGAPLTEFIIDLGSVTSSMTNLIPIFNDAVSGEATAVYSVTADGTNYETVTDKTIHRFTNTGTTIKLKIQLTPGADGNMAILNEYALKYNLY